MKNYFYSISRFQKSYLISILLILQFSFVNAQNPIPAENLLPGNPQSEWDITDAEIQQTDGNSILGFADDISYTAGSIISFKIDVAPAANYNIKIYRLGYYQGNGARLIADLGTLSGVDQPDGVFDPVTRYLDCNNWSVSATWNSTGALSGLYLAKLTRSGGGASHIAFVIRDDGSTSDLYFQVPDATWQAYNDYGGSSLYPSPGGKAVKVSYNRPIVSRAGTGGGIYKGNWLMEAEYPMIRWLERNGYYVSYTSNTDIARMSTNLILQHKVLLSVGHDEYWSKGMRDRVEEARDAGVHLAFFSGNEIYWKTRWEDGYKTLVCYKEGTLGENVCGGKCDPSPTEWTGLWRAGSGYDANAPENGLTGQISWNLATATLEVPDTYKKIRFWRNTTVENLLTGATATLGENTIGFEHDWEQYQSFYPNGRILMSNTNIGGKIHKISLYKHSSGALVFGAGTIQWAWGLDENHDRSSGETVNLDMQQATVNLFADMGVQPVTPHIGLVAATASSDFTAPTSVITVPADGSSFTAGTNVIVSGTATDIGGVVAGVEISFDGGTTWQVATIDAAEVNSNWSYTWVPQTPGAVTILSRGFDDSGNIGAASAGVDVTIGPFVCPCSLFDPSEGPVVPSEIEIDDLSAPVELGVNFESSVNGFITGVRFYKATDDGVYTLNLYNTSTQANLGTVTYSGATGTGWRLANLPSPVAITANTSYTVSYHITGNDYAITPFYFQAPVVRGPLKAYSTGYPDFLVNGVYQYNATPQFPGQTFQSANYWADVLFVTNITPTPVTLISFSGSLVEGNIELNWETASEQNNKGFEIQRTVNGSEWSAIGFVAGAGNSTTSKKYRFVDEKPAAGKYQYRLRQIDFDDSFKYSQIISKVISSQEGMKLYQNFPNPFNATTTIRFEVFQSTKLSLAIYDVNGRKVKVLYSGIKHAGLHAIVFNSKLLGAGVYYYKLTSDAWPSAVRQMIIK